MIDVKVTGLNEAIASLKKLGVDFLPNVAKVYDRHLPAISEDSATHTPVGETGNLKASNRALPAVIQAGEVKATVKAGNDDAWYVHIVHERLDVKHPNGEAKFLENAVNRGNPALEEDLKQVPFDTARAAGLTVT